MEVVTIAMHSKNSLDFSDKQLGFITFRPKGCNYLDFQVNIQPRHIECARCCVVTTLIFK